MPKTIDLANDDGLRIERNPFGTCCIGVEEWPLANSVVYRVVRWTDGKWEDRVEIICEDDFYSAEMYAHGFADGLAAA